MIGTPMSLPFRSFWFCLALAAAFTNAPAQVTNGSFETGNFTGWTLGVQKHAAVIQSSNLNPSPFPAADGTYFAVLSTGPGGISNTKYNVDGNGTNDYDLTSLSQTFTYNATTGQAMLLFAWTFASSEQDQSGQYDDVFDVQTTVGATTSKVLTGSACKNNGSSFSPYPNVACLTNGIVSINAPGTLINSTSLAFGVGQWQQACVPIPGIVAGNNTITVTFRVADQADNQVDSALFIDNVSVQPDCSRIGPTLQQITHSNGGNVQTKNGGLLFTPISNGPAFSADNTGTAFAFASTGNYTGDNPNVLQQVFVYDGSYTRVTGLALGADGNVQGVSLSGPTVGALHGRYVAIAATLNGSASPQIYRWDRQTSTLTQITNTTGCVNQNPSISSDGNRVAWETTCSAYTGQNVQKVVYSSFSGGAWSTPVNVLASGTPAATCQGWEPHLSRGDSPAGFLALRSNCGGLAGGAVTATNGDVFRLQLSTNSWKRITMATSAATTNTSISIDAASGVDAGRYIYFISDGNYFAIPNDTTLEIYRYDAALSALQQVTSTTSNGAYISVHQAADGKGVLFAYEFINGNSGRIEVGTGSYGGTITALKVAANPLVSLAADVGVDASNVPSVLFLSNDDLLGQNGDRNAEIYRATTP